MSGKISILASDPDFLVRKGIESFVKEQAEFVLIPSASNVKEMMHSLSLFHPDVLILDYKHFEEGAALIKKVRILSPLTGILIISNPDYQSDITQALSNGATSFLLRECEEVEILEAIHNTAKHKRFLCGKIIEKLTHGDTQSMGRSEASCAGLAVTEREIEIIRHVAEGLSNKEIAEKLFLSPHTVNTHRKNIMNKLQVNNTAGLVLYAIRNDILSPNKFLFS